MELANIDKAVFAYSFDYSFAKIFKRSSINGMPNSYNVIFMFAFKVLSS